MLKLPVATATLLGIDLTVGVLGAFRHSDFHKLVAVHGKVGFSKGCIGENRFRVAVEAGVFNNVAVLGHAGVGHHLPEKGRVGRNLVVDFRTSIQGHVPKTVDCHRHETALLVKDLEGGRASVGDKGIVRGKDHGGVAKVEGLVIIQIHFKVQSSCFARAYGAAADRSVPNTTGEACKLGGNRLVVAVFDKRFHKEDKRLVAIVRIKGTVVDPDPNRSLASAHHGRLVGDLDRPAERALAAGNSAGDVVAKASSEATITTVAVAAKGVGAETGIDGGKGSEESVDSNNATR